MVSEQQKLLQRLHLQALYVSGAKAERYNLAMLPAMRPQDVPGLLCYAGHGCVEAKHVARIAMHEVLAGADNCLRLQLLHPACVSTGQETAPTQLVGEAATEPVSVLVCEQNAVVATLCVHEGECDGASLVTGPAS